MTAPYYPRGREKATAILLPQVGKVLDSALLWLKPQQAIGATLLRNRTNQVDLSCHEVPGVPLNTSGRNSTVPSHIINAPRSGSHFLTTFCWLGQKVGRLAGRVPPVLEVQESFQKLKPINFAGPGRPAG